MEDIMVGSYPEIDWEVFMDAVPSNTESVIASGFEYGVSLVVQVSSSPYFALGSPIASCTPLLGLSRERCRESEFRCESYVPGSWY